MGDNFGNYPSAPFGQPYNNVYALPGQELGVGGSNSGLTGDLSPAPWKNTSPFQSMTSKYGFTKNVISPQMSDQSGQSGVRPGTNPGINAVQTPQRPTGVQPNGVSQGVNAGQNSQAAWDSVQQANGLANSNTNTTAWHDVSQPSGQAGSGGSGVGYKPAPSGNLNVNSDHASSPTNQSNSTGQQSNGTNPLVNTNIGGSDSTMTRMRGIGARLF